MARPKQLWIVLGGALGAAAVAGAAGLGRAALRRNGSQGSATAPSSDGSQGSATAPSSAGAETPEGLDGEAPRREAPASAQTSAPPARLAARPPGGDDRRTTPRAYRLGRGEPAGEGLRRIALGRLDHALEELRQGEDRAVAVHEARKDLKKMRAVLRLLRARVGAELYRRENASLRDTGRALSGARDAQVRLDTLAALVDDGTVDADAVAAFKSRLEAERDAAADREVPAGSVVTELQQAEQCVGAWAVGGDGWDAVEAGLKRSYRRGRARMRDATKAPTTDNLHEWRKRVKDLWYHLRILSPAWPPVLEALAGEAHVLSEQLGDDHDLAVLAASARENFDAFPDPTQLDLLLEAVERARSELQGAAFSLGLRLYADRPGAFVARVEAWWRAWRPEH